MSDSTMTAPGFEHVHRPGTSGWTLLLLHGTGGDEHQLVDLGRQIAPEAALLSPRGNVLEGGVTRRWFRRHSMTELDVEDLKARTDELAAFVRAAATGYGLDPARIIAAGYSNGANIGVGLLLRHPGLLRGAVLWRPTLPYEPDQALSLAGTDVLLATGVGDPYVPAGRAERLAELLRAGGARVTWQARDTGHALAQSDFDDAASWLADVMAGGTA
jgi:phospholipase/carboxylesterase